MAKEKAKHDGLLCFLLALIVVLILVIGGGAYYFLVVDNGEKIAESETENNSAIVENKKDSNVNSNTNVLDTNKETEKLVDEKNYESIAKKLFEKELSNLKLDGIGKLEDYRIDKIKILTNKEVEELKKLYKDSDYKVNDILIEFTYSIKPEGNIDAWLIGNGIKEGEWIVDKFICKVLRNEELINIGTSW